LTKKVQSSQALKRHRMRYSGSFFYVPMFQHAIRKYFIDRSLSCMPCSSVIVYFQNNRFLALWIAPDSTVLNSFGGIFWEIKWFQVEFISTVSKFDYSMCRNMDCKSAWSGWPTWQHIIDIPVANLPYRPDFLQL